MVFLPSITTSLGTLGWITWSPNHDLLCSEGRYAVIIDYPRSKDGKVLAGPEPRLWVHLPFSGELVSGRD